MKHILTPSLKLTKTSIMFTILYIAASLLLLWLCASYKQTILFRPEVISEKEQNYRRMYGNTSTIKQVPYLIRYTLLSCPVFSVKIHKVLRSDTDECHDHPWNYISFILKGGYIEMQEKVEEVYSNGATPELNTPTRCFKVSRIKFYRPGSIIYRNAKIFHKLILMNGTPCISLIFTFRKWKSWGYINNPTHRLDFPL